jgi:hypothetical protein
MYHCYKNYYSVGLLAPTDTNQKFTVDIGSSGKGNDDGDLTVAGCVAHSHHVLPRSTVKEPFCFPW